MHLLTKHSESSAVGSALRSGRRGRAFESPLSDKKEVFKRLPFFALSLNVIQSEAKNLEYIHVCVLEILHYTPFRSE